MKLTVYHQSGSSSVLELPVAIENTELTPSLIHQAVVTEASNARGVHAHTKNRAEVRGGGKKPWRQKGTGRARHGSIRSPLWVGGGITFGPTSARNYAKDLPRMMRLRAFQMALSAKLQANAFRVIDTWGELPPKTKSMKRVFEALPQLGKRVLVIFSASELNLILAARNLRGVELALAPSVRTTDILTADTIIVDRVTLDHLLMRGFGMQTETVQTKGTPKKSTKAKASAKTKVAA